VWQLGLWDTGGGEDYARLRPLSYPQTDCFLLCFAVVPYLDWNRWRDGEDNDTLANLRTEWIPELRHFCPDTPIVLCGTMRDLRESEEALEFARDRGLQVFSFKDGVELAKEFDCVSYMECSALTGEGVHEVFEECVEYLRMGGRASAGARSVCVLQ
jgi:GTPase SAR1 family protein